jgi:hypothetical protein
VALWVGVAGVTSGGAGVSEGGGDAVGAWFGWATGDAQLASARRTTTHWARTRKGRFVRSRRFAGLARWLGVQRKLVGIKDDPPADISSPFGGLTASS